MIPNLAGAEPSETSRSWVLSSFIARSNRNPLLDIVRLRIGTFEPQWIIGLGAHYPFYSDQRFVQLEGASQVVKHTERALMFEWDVFVVFRWLWFPWDRFVPTTIAAGQGWSLVTHEVTHEVENHGIRNPFLSYLMLEMTFDLSQRWIFTLRLHHRSGIYGLIADGGSNYLGFGLSYRH